LVPDGVLITRGFVFLLSRLVGFFWSSSFVMIECVRGWCMFSICFLVGLKLNVEFFTENLHQFANVGSIAGLLVSFSSTDWWFLN